MPRGRPAKGSLREIRPGVWYGRVSLGYSDAKGKYDRPSKLFYGPISKTQKEYDRWKIQMQDQVGLRNDMPLGEFLKEWLELYVTTNTRNVTARSYESTVNKYLIPTLGKYPLDKLTPILISRYYFNTMETYGLSPQSIKHHHEILRNALNQAEKWGYIKGNPARLASYPRVPRREQTDINVEEVEALLFAVRATVWFVPIWVAAYCGLRRSELLGLRWQDIDFDKNFLTVNQSLKMARGRKVIIDPTKNPSSHDIVRFGSVTAEILKQWYERQKNSGLYIMKPSTLVFCDDSGFVLLPDSLSQFFYRTSRKLGYNFTFHDLRHAQANMLLNMGENMKVIQERLRHADIATTGNMYTQSNDKMMNDVAERLEGFILRGKLGNLGNDLEMTGNFLSYLR